MWTINIASLNIAPYIVMVVGVLLTIATSGYVVRHFIGTIPNTVKPRSNESRYDVGSIIGKCENFIVISLILSGAYTALAIVFTAKSIVRRDDIQKNPKYYLGGTLVNFCYSLLMGFIINFLISLAVLK